MRGKDWGGKIERMGERMRGKDWGEIMEEKDRHAY